MENKIKVIENFSGYKVFKIIQGGEDKFYRCSNHFESYGYNVDEMIYDKENDLFELESSCFWVSTIKECKSALEVWAD